jgi:branched-chain amino acid:cation transporter, LIVCS family
MDMYLVTVGLAIFSMLFGAGNLIYPLMVGLSAGSLTGIGMTGFLLSAAVLPLVGLIAMILFDGDYDAFFERIGKVPGQIIIFVCMMIIGPVIAIPRITTLSHTMIAPFLPFFNDTNMLSSALFAVLFLGITFLATYQENKIITVLGNVISPLLLASLACIIAKGIWTADHTFVPLQSGLTIFTTNFMRGYETLDLIGAIFFASIIITLLKYNTRGTVTMRQLSAMGLKAGIFGTLCLCGVYIGMSILSMYHSQGLEYLGGGQLFRELTFKILGTHGTIIIATAVLMACFSTAIALSAVVAEYIEHTVTKNSLSYIQALILTMLLSMPLSIFGLDYVLACAGGPVVYIIYPIIITITICNIGYKLFNFTWIKAPVALVTCLVLASYCWPVIAPYLSH